MRKRVYYYERNVLRTCSVYIYIITSRYFTLPLVGYTTVKKYHYTWLISVHTPFLGHGCLAYIQLYKTNHDRLM